jgi:hypothetical protein
MYRTENFSNTADMDFFLNGGVKGGKRVVSGADKGRIHGLHDLTLIVNAETTTFSDASGVGLTPAQVKAAIEAATTSLTVVWRDGCLAFLHASSVTVGSAGTANRIFGFSSSEDSVNQPFGTPGSSAPAIVTISGSPTGDSIQVLLEIS